MSTRSYKSLRQVLHTVLTPLLFCVAVTGAGAQSAAPAILPSAATTLAPPTGLGSIGQSALTTSGDLVFVDHTNDAVYEYPAGGGAVVTLVAAGGLASGYGAGHNPGIVIDSYNAMYLEGNYSNCLLRFPYDPSTKSWPGLATLTTANPSSKCAAPYVFAQYSVLNVSPYYFQPSALAIDKNNNILVTTQTSGSNDAFVIPLVGSGATATAGTTSHNVLTKATKPPQSAAMDIFGNYYIVESSGGPAGVLELPAGSTDVADDSKLTRVDPSLSNVDGVATDLAGNLYISDAKLGVYFVPNASGTPQTTSAVLLTPLPATAQVTVDTARGLVYVPTTNASGAAVIASVRFTAGEFGTLATATANTTAQAVTFSFSAAVTPASFVIQEAGATSPDFTIAQGGSCAAGTAYAAQSSCTVNVLFSPHAAGNVAAKLLMLDGSGNTLASLNLHGTGSGSAVQVLPGSETVMGSGLKTPTQVAVDAGGNVYVADAGLGAVELFPKGASATTAGTVLGTGIKAPSGVAVDGAGDVFIADSGSVYEIPVGGAGLNTAGQITVKTGLGSGVQLATGGSGRLYILDPQNHRVIRLGGVGGSFSLYSQTETDYSGFFAPAAIAVDQNQNLLVADGSNLYEVSSTGTQTTLLAGTAAITGLAVDPSGSVYVTTQGQTFRIPYVGSALSQSAQTALAADVTGATSVAIDPALNVYVLNASAGNVTMVSSSAFFNFGTLTTTTSSGSQGFTVLDSGNLPLNVTGFSTQLNFSETATTCTGAAVAVNSTCSLTVTFNPSPGQQGTLTGSVLIIGDEANTPVGVNGTGVGAALAASKTAAAATNPTTDNAPVVVTVTSASGTGPTPTGTVTLTATGGGLTAPATVSGTLSGGTATLLPPQLAVNTYTFTVNYVGDRAYSPSSTTLKVTLGAGPVQLIQQTMAQVQAALPTYPYVLSTSSGAAEPYDGSTTQYAYKYPLKILTADGAPLIGIPAYDGNGKQIGTNYGSISFTGAPSGGTCPAIPVAADGTASLDTGCLSINTANSSIPNIMNSYTLTPVYSPNYYAPAAVGAVNPNYATVTGTAISFTALRNPMVTISSNPSALTVKAGSTASATLTLTSLLGYGVAGSGGKLNNWSLPVQLACDGLPAYATCSFSYPKPDPTDPQSVDVGPTPGTVVAYRGNPAAPCTVAQNCVGPGTVIMTINTNVTTSTVTTSMIRHGKSEAAYAAVFGLGLLGLTFGKRKTLRARLLLLLCLVSCGGVMAGISGCSTTQLGTTIGTPTPTGAFTVLVTAKQVGSQTVVADGSTVYGNQNQVSLPFTVNVTIQ